MYVAKIPNRNSPPCYLIRQSKRVGQSIRKTTLANISKLPLEVIEQIRVVLRGGIPVEKIEDAFSLISSKPCPLTTKGG